jgi:hypothetical protein
VLPSKPVTRVSWTDGALMLIARTLAPVTAPPVSQRSTLPAIVPSVVVNVGPG